MRGFGNNDYGRPSDRKAARFSNIVCNLLFAVFSAVYLGVFQCDVMKALHYSLAHGKTTFALVPTVGVLTILLLLLSWGVNMFLKLRGRAAVLAFVPSFLALVALTDVGRNLYTSEYYSVWWWLMPLLTVIYVSAVKLIDANKYASRKTPESNELFLWNSSAMLVMSIATVAMGNTNAMFHNELRMEHLMIKGDNTEALAVARKSYSSTRTLTALRSLALSKSKALGEKLFEYPQRYGADGLFFDNDSALTLRYTNDSVYALIGGTPNDWENSQTFLKRICYDDTGTSKAVEYYMAALLLNKDLNEYAVALNDFFMKGDSVQRYLQEAMVMYKEINPQWTGIVEADTAVTARFHEYNAYKNQTYHTEKERENRLRNKFGDTYWWYYDYQK